jgi:Family of unknown function (DUF6098)
VAQHAGTHDVHEKDLSEITDLRELAELVGRYEALYVRWSRGPASDAGQCSRDHASGLDMPGLAVNPLTPPSWWTRPVEEWVARQITAYDHLGRDAPDHIAWVLTGRIVDRGPDNEPLVVDVEPVARLAAAVLSEAADSQPRSDRAADEDTSWRS